MSARSNVVWVHLDALSLDHPVMTAAGEGTRAVFVWDALDLQRRGWTLKRCLFLHETLAEMGVEVVVGDTADCLRELGAYTLHAAETPDPDLQAVMAALDIRAVADKPFSTVPPGTDMGRFFRFWNQAKRSALTHTMNQ